MPVVSVIIPTFKHRDYVLATLDSVFAQTFVDYEIIVINDGSPDDTAAVLKPLADAGRIRYFDQPNAGQAAARNRGLEMAGGTFIAYLDDDDLWPTDKLAWQVEFLRANDAVAVGGLSQKLRDGVLEPIDADGRTTTLAVRDFYSGNPFYSPGEVLIRADALRAVGGYDREIWGCDDLDLFMRLAAYGAFEQVNRVALHYRFHATNASHAWERMLVNSRKALTKNLALLPTDQRDAARKEGERFNYFYLGAPRLQGGWSFRASRVKAAAQAIGYFIGPARSDARLALAIARDCVPLLLRRTLRAQSQQQ